MVRDCELGRLSGEPSPARISEGVLLENGHTAAMAALCQHQGAPQSLMQHLIVIFPGVMDLQLARAMLRCTLAAVAKGMKPVPPRAGTFVLKSFPTKPEFAFLAF